MTDIDNKLEILYDLMVDNYGTLTAELNLLISNPPVIKNTHKFSLLLAGLKDSVFIDPLLKKISLADRNDKWLLDFIYAATSLLDECSSNDTFKCPNNLVEKLEEWILKGSGTLAWYATDLLKFNESKSAENIQLKKLEQRGDFFLTYVECISGLLRIDNDRHIELVRQIAADETRDEKLREYCNNLIKEQI